MAISTSRVRRLRPAGAVLAAGALIIPLSLGTAAAAPAAPGDDTAQSEDTTAQSGATAQSGETAQSGATAAPAEESAAPSADIAPSAAADILTIAEIQGTGDASPLVGQEVTTQGVVTASYPQGTGSFNGYVIQTPDAEGGDTTPGASDAVFVYSRDTVAEVEIGDSVQVTGEVSEYYGLTEISVPAGGASVLAEALGEVAPLSTAWPPTDEEREALESQLVAPEGAFTVSDTYSTNRYGEVLLAAGDSPLLQPTDVAAPGSAQAAAVEADNLARAVTLDDATTINYLNTDNSSLVPPYISLDAPVRVGAPVTFDEGVIVDYRNDTWKFNPTTAIRDGGQGPVSFANTRTDAPQAVGGDIQIATFNVLNYFTTLGVDTPSCVPYTDRDGAGLTVKEGCAQRGAWDQASFDRQQAKIVAAINALDADVVGLLEIENSAALGDAPDTPDAALATLVDALNAAAGADTWAYVPSSEELPDASVRDVITNALIYKPAVVETVGEARALGTESEGDGAFANAREPIGQEFAPVEGGDPVFVAVNHFKSKSSPGPWPGDADAGDGQGASNESRTRQAEALRDWVEGIVDESESVALIGDFNSYTQEDPLQVLYDAGYTDAASTLADGHQYSYSYSGLSGSLDHVLLNRAARGHAAGADIWEINAEESVALEYSRYNVHGQLYYADDAFRSSDHNPVAVGLYSHPVVDVNIVNINDFHGRIDDNTLAFAATVEGLLNQNPDSSAFVSVGDNIGASLFASSSADDIPTIDVLNALGLKASAVGNHELDKGFDDLAGRVTAASDFPYLGANIYEKGTDTPALQEYAIEEIAGIDVGFIGVITEETPSLVSPGGITDIDFGNPVEALNRVTAQLSDGNDANGEADVVVALVHEGAGAGTPDGSTLEQEVVAGGAFADIVENTDPRVDAILTGHTHKQYTWDAPVPGEEGRTRPIIQTGSYGAFVGHTTLTVDPDTFEVVAYTAENVERGETPTEDEVAANPVLGQVQTIVTDALEEAAEIGNEPIGSVTADITTAFSGGTYVDGVYVGPGPGATDGRDDRGSESALGNLVGNALRASLASEERGGAEIGIVNPGGLRAELLYGEDGVITYAEANSVLPFVNNLWTLTLTGAQLEEVLEQQWQTDDEGERPSRPYLALGLSDNVSWVARTADPNAEPGDNVLAVYVDGQLVQPDDTFRVATFSFLGTGGDNFREFADATDVRDSGLIDRDAWIAYLTDNSPVSPSFARSRTVAGDGLPDAVRAGNEVSLGLSGINLTSLGSPLNTTATAELVPTGETRAAPIPLGTVDVDEGAAAIATAIPADTAAGQYTLAVTWEPSGTVSRLPLEVTASSPAPTPSESGTPGESPTSTPSPTGTASGSGGPGSGGSLADTGADLGLPLMVAVALLGAAGALVGLRRRSAKE